MEKKKLENYEIAYYINTISLIITMIKSQVYELKTSSNATRYLVGLKMMFEDLQIVNQDLKEYAGIIAYQDFYLLHQLSKTLKLSINELSIMYKDNKEYNQYSTIRLYKYMEQLITIKENLENSYIE